MEDICQDISVCSNEYGRFDERTERKRFRRIAARKAIFDRIRFCTENEKPEGVCVYMCMCV